MNRKGISRDDTVVIYGDKSNWWAAYALWVFTLFGHPDVRLLNGGRDAWLAEGRDTTLEVPGRTTTGYPVVPRDDAPIRAYKDDVRPPSGRPPDRRPLAPGVHRRTHPHAGLPGGGRPAGRPHPDRGLGSLGQGGRRHRPLPQPRGTRRDLLLRLPDADPPTIAYCRIGERSSHTWFVLTHLLGIPGCATTTGPGPNGATLCVCPSSTVTNRICARADMSMPGPLAEVVAEVRRRLRPGQTEAAAGVRRRTAPAARRPRGGGDGTSAGARRRCSCPHVDADDRDRVRLYFSAPAEAPHPRGFASILATGLDGQPADTILSCRTTSTPNWGWPADQPAAAARHVGHADPDQAAAAGGSVTAAERDPASRDKVSVMSMSCPSLFDSGLPPANGTRQLGIGCSPAPVSVPSLCKFKETGGLAAATAGRRSDSPANSYS